MLLFEKFLAIILSFFGKIEVEVPHYKLVDQINDVEIREYENMNFACTQEVPEINSFEILAKYIGVFGKPENDKYMKIPMTAPVINYKDYD